MYKILYYVHTQSLLYRQVCYTHIHIETEVNKIKIPLRFVISFVFGGHRVKLFKSTYITRTYTHTCEISTQGPHVVCSYSSSVSSYSLFFLYHPCTCSLYSYISNWRIYFGTFISILFYIHFLPLFFYSRIFLLLFLPYGVFFPYISLYNLLFSILNYYSVSFNLNCRVYIFLFKHPPP